MPHLMRAFNASKAALTRFVLLGAVLSSHWATSPSTVIPEKDNIKCLCLIRRQKKDIFFSIGRRLLDWCASNYAEETIIN